MSIHMVEKALFDIAASPASVQQYKAGPDAFLSRYVLDQDEVAMIRGMDVRLMLERQANPMLAMRAYSSVEGRAAMPEYLRRLKA